MEPRRMTAAFAYTLALRTKALAERFDHVAREFSSLADEIKGLREVLSAWERDAPGEIANPYPETVVDEASGVEVSGDLHRAWDEGFRAGMHTAAGLVGEVLKEMLENFTSKTERRPHEDLPR